MGGNIDKKINDGEGPYVFRVNGQIHHRIGSLLPVPNNCPKFAELYIFDTKNEIENRIRAITNEEPSEKDLDPKIVTGLQRILDECNPLVKIFRRARDFLEHHKGIDIAIRIIGADKETIDSWISVEIPDPETDPLGYALVAEHMNITPLSQLRPGIYNYVICVRISRVWEFHGKNDHDTIKHLDLVIIDQKGTAMYAEVPPEAISNL
ncbi:hypothetical protein U9M48_030687 [Paspalum notatum var. saurae]|uniref:Replication protein A 70 kDa DNA-binding subunit B/D first OB fold domain-containing protein n=1 Tax=Paspalum notatum var. saurae TaxID=547442 RepID=A0AAQ3U0Y5_PASNO